MLEIHYKGATSPNAPTLAFVGKGVSSISGWDMQGEAYLTIKTSADHL